MEQIDVTSHIFSPFGYDNTLEYNLAIKERLGIHFCTMGGTCLDQEQRPQKSKIIKKQFMAVMAERASEIP